MMRKRYIKYAFLSAPFIFMSILARILRESCANRNFVV